MNTDTTDLKRAKLNPSLTGTGMDTIDKKRK
jgi:hypothetical protein